MNSKYETSPARLWGLALGAILAVQNDYDHRQLVGDELSTASIESCRKIFNRDWEITTTDDFWNKLFKLVSTGHNAGFMEQRSFLATLTAAGQSAFIASLAVGTVEWIDYKIVYLYHRKLPPAGIAAWDYGRAVNQCRSATKIGLISSDEAWKQILDIAVKAQQAYSSWFEYGMAYLAGRQYWLGELNEQRIAEHLEYISPLLLDRDSPWQQLAWHTNLDV